MFLIYFNTENVWSTITTYTCEVFPTQIRNSAAGVIHGCAVVGAVINVMITPMIMAQSPQLPFYLNSVAFLIGAFLTALLRVETSGQSLA